MKGSLLLLAFGLFAQMAAADYLVPTRTLRANTPLSIEDFRIVPGNQPGSLEKLLEIDGMEARVALYAGRPVFPSDVGPAALVERNQIVKLGFSHGSLVIFAEGRALGRGRLGDAIRVMNLASRTTLIGVVQPDGSIKVSQ